MNRGKIILIIVLLALLTVGCNSNNKHTYNINYNGNNYTVNTENKTITCKGISYTYEIDNSMTIITFPNGAQYRAKKEGNTTLFEEVGSIDSTYISGAELADLLTSNKYIYSSFEDLYFLPIIFCLGIVNVFIPQVYWYLFHGWKYKNVSPSNLFLSLIRISGLVVILLGIAYICHFFG